MAYERINWHNEPSEATALNDVNLNKMDSAIYELDGKATATDTAITNLQNGKVDKVTGKGLSELSKLTITPDTVDGNFVASIKMYDAEGEQTSVYLRNGVTVDSALSNSSTNPVQNKVVKSAIDGKSTVAISDTLATGTTLANITIDGTTTAIKGSDIEVDEELSPTSTNPVENKAIYDALNNLLPSKTVSGNPISISDASGFNAKALTVSMNPIQDLHGYSNPWAGGAGKNKLKVTATTQTINGVTFTVNSDGTVSLSGTASDTSIFDVATFSAVGGTAYKLSGCPSGGSTTKYLLSIPAVGYDSGSGYNYTPSTSADVLVRITIYSGQNTQGLVFKPMICLASAPNPDYAHYEPYENICPITGRTEASVTRTGVNQWDEQWESGAFNQITGVKINSDTSIRSKNKIVIKGGVEYYFSIPSTGIRYFTYTNDGYVETGLIRSSGKKTFNSDVCYINFQIGVTTYGNNISINYPSTDTEYHASAGAETHTHQYSETIYGGEDDFVNGEATSTYGFVDLGTLNYTYVESLQAFYTDGVASTVKRTANDAEIPTWLLSSAYTQHSVNSTIQGRGDGRIAVASNGRVWLSNYSYTDATALKTAMNGIDFCFGLATPATISTSAEEITLLKGNNVLSTNADDMELKYSVSLDSLLS